LITKCPAKNLGSLCIAPHLANVPPHLVRSLVPPSNNSAPASGPPGRTAGGPDV
jgi:hypothetical protein